MYGTGVSHGHQYPLQDYVAVNHPFDHIYGTSIPQRNMIHAPV